MEEVISKKNKHHTYNVASPHYCTINELTKIITNATMSSSNIQTDVDIYKEYGSAFEDTHTRIANTDRLCPFIGCHNFKRISEIVSDVTSYIKNKGLHL